MVKLEAYKIIVVDDEEEIREGIIRRIQWEKYGFIVAGSSENGKEALELAERVQPDVVMTDIMMPFMDGLELGQKIMEFLPNTKIIIFSGSDDLEYAHKAIKINVVEYVLKPVNAIDMEEVLTKLKKQLDTEYESKRNLETLRQQYMDSLPVIREQFLVSLVEGRITKKQFDRQSAMAGIDIDAAGFAVALFYMDRDISNQTNRDIFKNHDDALIPITIKQLADEIIHKYCDFTSFLYGDMIALIVNLNFSDNINDLIRGVNEVCTEAGKIYGLIVSGGISLMCHDPWEIRYARKEAQSALDYRLILGAGKSIYIGDVEPDTTIRLKFFGQDERAVMTSIKMGNPEVIENTVDEVFEKFEKAVLPLNQYKIYFMEVMAAFLQLIQTYHLDFIEVFGEDFNFFNPLESITSMESLREWVKDSSIKISHLIKRERVDSASLVVNSAKQYVKDNYYDCELTVEALSEHLHMSPAYFSTLFKRETGSTFITYLTEVRLEMALKLLNTTDDKSYIIAEKVGYSEPNYFSYVFKKKYGVSPTKYRNS